MKEKRKKMGANKYVTFAVRCVREKYVLRAPKIEWNAEKIRDLQLLGWTNCFAFMWLGKHEHNVITAF